MAVSAIHQSQAKDTKLVTFTIHDIILHQKTDDDFSYMIEIKKTDPSESKSYLLFIVLLFPNNASYHKKSPSMHVSTQFLSIHHPQRNLILLLKLVTLQFCRLQSSAWNAILFENSVKTVRKQQPPVDRALSRGSELEFGTHRTNS